MKGPQRDPAQVLARARSAWTPGAADAERVRRALDAALAGGGAPAASTRATGWARRVLAAGAIAAASGGAGYWAGHRAGLRDGMPPMPAVEVARRAVATTSSLSPPVPPQTETRPSLAPPAPVPSRHEGHAARHGAEIPSTDEADSLAVEVRALRNVERALRDGNPGLALAFLHELDRQVPQGRLVEERDAAATLAYCARGDRPFDVDLAAEFAERHPASVYRARIEDACAKTDSPASGDSRSRRTGP